MRRDLLITGILCLIVGFSAGYLVASGQFLGRARKSMHDLVNDARARDSDPRVRVLAKQFSWHFHYPGPDKQFGASDVEHINLENPAGIDWSDPRAADDFVSEELVLPCDTLLTLLVTSSDVIHCLGNLEGDFSQDAIPGREIPASLKTPAHPRHGTLRCEQLCGAGHAHHHAPYRFVGVADLLAWKSDRSSSLPKPGKAEPLVDR